MASVFWPLDLLLEDCTDTAWIVYTVSCIVYRVHEYTDLICLMCWTAQMRVAWVEEELLEAAIALHSEE